MILVWPVHQACLSAIPAEAGSQAFFFLDRYLSTTACMRTGKGIIPNLWFCPDSNIVFVGMYLEIFKLGSVGR